MSESWELLSADEAERRQFLGMESTLALPGASAAPPNRFREVRRIDSPIGTYFLKIFHHTQLKNRLRFALTPPRSRSDAEREARVATALRERGIHTPRPVALGRRGPASFYLCAEMPGTTLVELLRQRRCNRDLAAGFARFCGGILKSGVILPDLSAEHVYRDLETARFGVLDLHNGFLSHAVPRRSALRVVKHFRRSVQGVAIPRPRAMAFAARLLKAAGLKGQTRGILARVPPLDTHSRYESQRRAAAYRDRNPLRTARELDLLRRVWPGEPGELVLDVPCGLGRLTPLLMDALGVHLVSADRSAYMLQTTGQKLRDKDGQPPLTLRADSFSLPFADRSLDGAVVFRFLHHLPPDQARRAVTEASRTVKSFVVVSFFHPISLHGVRRRLVELITGRARTRHALTLRRIRSWMARLGFRLHKIGAERRYLRDFWLASFVRERE